MTAVLERPEVETGAMVNGMNANALHTAVSDALHFTVSSRGQHRRCVVPA